AQGSDRIKIGLIGCGGRGTGAALDALQADPGATLTAMGDVLKSALDSSLDNMKGVPEFTSKIMVTPENKFVGLDAYLGVINSGVDVVRLTTPPGSRHQHIKAAVAATKHIFAENAIGTALVG